MLKHFAYLSLMAVTIMGGLGLFVVTWLMWDWYYSYFIIPAFETATFLSWAYPTVSRLYMLANMFYFFCLFGGIALGGVFGILTYVSWCVYILYVVNPMVMLGEALFK